MLTFEWLSMILSPRYALCKTVELTENFLRECNPSYVVVVTDQDDQSYGFTPHDRAEILSVVEKQYVFLKQFDPYPGVKFLHSHWALRYEFPKLSLVALLGNSHELISGPRIRVYGKPGAGAL